MAESSIELLRQACGATGPLKLNVEGPGPEVQPWTLELPWALIGRDPHVDVPLSYEAVHRRHAYWQMIDGRLFCISLPGPPGIGAPSSSDPATWLERGQAVRVGPVWVRFLAGDQGPSLAHSSNWSPLAAQPAEQTSAPGVTLEILEGAPQPITWRMDRILALIGRSSSCKVRLVDATVSWVHGSLVRTSAGVWVVDLLGRGGIVVNGARVRWACLQDGDRLQIGKFLVRVLCERPTFLPALAGTTSRALPAPALPTVSRGSAVLVPAELLPARSEGSEAFLMPLVSQFAQMQQEMFDQFQQGLQMVVQMFGNLHREQMVHIHGELDRLHQLTAELNSLKAELNKHPPPASPSRVPYPSPPGPAPGAARSPSPQSEDVPPQAAPAGPAVNGGKTGAATSGQSAEEIHLWLSKRIAAVQQERQNRWQKIVSFLTSGRGGDNVP